MRRIVAEDLEWSRKRKAHLERLGFPVESSISPGTGSTSVMNSAHVNIIADGIDNPGGDVEKTPAKCDLWGAVAAACLS